MDDLTKEIISGLQNGTIIPMFLSVNAPVEVSQKDSTDSFSSSDVPITLLGLRYMLNAPVESGMYIWNKVESVTTEKE